MPEQLLVACLCAAWCGTCTAYRETLREVARGLPAMRFAWFDIEDDADALGDDALDVEDFPTVLVLRGGRPLFLGPLLPHAQTLRRMLDVLAADPAAPVVKAPPHLVAAVMQLASQRPIDD